MNRSLLRQIAFEAVRDNMKLRKPQIDSLLKLHSIYLNVPDYLPNVNRQDFLQIFRQHCPGWQFATDFPEMTFALATGVGKTRLMGAIIAYLYKAGESKNFVILAPRTTIVDKIIRECSPAHMKYLFVEKNFIPLPHILTGNDFETYDRPQLEGLNGPAIWILSPQAIARTKDAASLRFHRRTEYQEFSSYEYLAQLDDLVVFFDESHHLGKDSYGLEPAWTKGVRDLKPRMLIEMTASPRQGANILHTYSLHDCIREGLYTKKVQVIVDKRPDGIADRDWDRTVLRAALDRLAVKESTMDRIADNGSKPQPLLLVCAADIDHAKDVTQWLGTQIGPEAILEVHSESKKNGDNYFEKLLAVEHPQSTIRVVVNVFMLTEGWDVTNVYVIAPLRALATVTGAIQTMGRGLRLPFSKRVGDEELDTLDILCFGRQSLSEVISDVLKEGFGRKEDGETYIDVREIVRDGEKPAERKEYLMIPVKKVSLDVPEIELVSPAVDLSNIRISARERDFLKAIELNNPETLRKLAGKPGFEWEEFVDIATTVALRRNPRIGGVTAAGQLGDAIIRCLKESGFAEDGIIRSEPEVVGNLVAQAAENLLAAQVPSYIAREKKKKIVPGEFEIRVPLEFKKVVKASDIEFTVRDRHFPFKEWPVGGWSRCVYKAVPFDTPTELHVAKLLDRSGEIDWWLRNLSHIFQLNTPVGKYSPDFLFLIKVAGSMVILEVKDDRLPYNPYGEVAAKARAAEAWCSAVREATKQAWEYWLVLNRDAARAETFDDLESAAEDWRLVVPGS